MRNQVFAAVVAFALAGTAQAQEGEAPGEMSVAQFIELYESVDANRLRQKAQQEGSEVLSQDAGIVRVAEAMKTAAAAYRKKIAADKASGLEPHSCPPEAPQQLSSDDLLAHLRSYPEAQRSSVSLAVGFQDMMLERYPCE